MEGGDVNNEKAGALLGGRKAQHNQTLKDSLRTTPIHRDIKRQIAIELWGDPGARNQSFSADDLDTYFSYYTEQSDLFLHDLGRYISVKSHEEMISIIRLLRTNIDRTALFQYLSSKEQPPDAGRLHASINLAVRLLSMIEIGEVPRSFVGRKGLEWAEGPLTSFLKAQFPPEGRLDREHVKLERLFMAINLERIAGIRICWTNNLADHLRMMEEDSVVGIFHHRFFLTSAKDSDLFPPGFIDETIRTISLLFPRNDTETRKWFRKMQKADQLDPGTLLCECLRAEDRHIGRFRFWRDRIIILKQVFDESKPTSWAQWWYDRRNGYERYPILLAAAALAFTAFFGLIQCIEGALQVYKAYNPS